MIFTCGHHCHELDSGPPLQEAGLAPDPVCKACSIALGTKHHRYFECPAYRAQRWELPDPIWLHAAETSDDHWLWTRGLAKDPSEGRAFHPSGGDQHLHWQGLLFFIGDICVDGSRLGPQNTKMQVKQVVQLCSYQTMQTKWWQQLGGPLPDICQCSLERSRGQSCVLLL